MMEMPSMPSSDAVEAMAREVKGVYSHGQDSNKLQFEICLNVQRALLRYLLYVVGSRICATVGSNPCRS